MNISQQLGRLKRGIFRIKKVPRFLILLITSIATIQFLILPALTQQPVTIQVLMSALEANQWQPFVEDFEEENPGINLEIREGPRATDAVEDLYSSAFLLGDSPFDLVYLDIVWVSKFAAAGWLMPLSDRITEDELSKFLQGDVNGGRYNGELYRMPFRSDGGMLYYRTDLLEQGGYEPPETFNELMQISQALQQQTGVEWGYIWQGKQYEGLSAMFIEILEGFGGFWVNPDTLAVGLDQPEAIEAVNFLLNTIEEGISPPGVTTYTEEETRLLFKNGKTVFLRNWPYVYDLASQPEESDIAGEFAIKPMVHQPSHSSGACQGGWGLGISKLTKHPDEAWKVIEFFNRPDVQKRFSLATGYAPALKSLYTDSELVAKYSYFPQLLEVLEKAVLRPPIAQYAQTSDILQRYLSAAITKTMTPEQAMNRAAQETRRLLGD
ncbi:ABC transporter substrate-binding protein [Coleofasciculus sp.]|uniref:ABC transporter substrate-binding protein n=1 Tax=Coleofasciculus sp. TaxID=3100458 RepID=UPI003A2F60C3